MEHSLYKTALSSTDPNKRIEALKWFRKRGVLQNDVRDDIFKRCQDESPRVRCEALATRVSCGDEDLYQSLLSALFNNDERVVIGAALALGCLQRLSSIPYLMKAFQTNNAKVGASLAWALGNSRAHISRALLEHALKHNFVPACSVEAIGKIGDVASLPSLEQASKHESHVVRICTARAIASLDYRFAEKAVLHSARAILKKLGEDENRQVRLSAIHAQHLIEKWE